MKSALSRTLRRGGGSGKKGAAAAAVAAQPALTEETLAALSEGESADGAPALDAVSALSPGAAPRRYPPEMWFLPLDLPQLFQVACVMHTVLGSNAGRIQWGVFLSGASSGVSLFPQVCCRCHAQTICDPKLEA